MYSADTAYDFNSVATVCETLMLIIVRVGSYASISTLTKLCHLCVYCRIRHENGTLII